MKRNVEVERKWVLPGFTDFSSLYPRLYPGLYPQSATDITQWYIGSPTGGFRIRDANGTYTVTKKSDGDVARVEDEVEIPKWLFDELCAMTNIGLSKTRWVYHDTRDVKLELDVYRGDLEGLFTVEAEWITSVIDSGEFDANALHEEIRLTYPGIFEYELPDWLGEAVEVSYDPRYKNSNLARHGLPT